MTKKDKIRNTSGQNVSPPQGGCSQPSRWGEELGHLGVAQSSTSPQCGEEPAGWRKGGGGLGI